MARSSEVAVVLGTRPEIVELRPIVGLLCDRGDPVLIGQHLDHRILEPFMVQFSGRPSSLPLLDETCSRGARLGRLVELFDEGWQRRRPSVVVVQGETTSALAGDLAADTLDLPLVHVQAGLQSYDRRMPEEHHRVLLDHLADLCCAADAANLASEGVAPERVVVTVDPDLEGVQSDWRGELHERPSPFGDGTASRRIVELLSGCVT